MPMTALDRLNNYRARYRSTLSARKISEPLVRALYWKQEMWLWTDVYRGVDNPSAAADLASDELASARAEYRLIIRRAWAMRVSERMEAA